MKASEKAVYCVLVTQYRQFSHQTHFKSLIQLLQWTYMYAVVSRGVLFRCLKYSFLVGFGGLSMTIRGRVKLEANSRLHDPSLGVFGMVPKSV